MPRQVPAAGDQALRAMWARLSYRARRAVSGLGPWLGSWQLSVVVMLAGALYYGLLAIWSTSTPAHVVASIADLAPFLLVYALLLVNTAVCLWQRLGRLRRDPAPFLFHGAFFLVALGVALTTLGRREATVWVAEGEAFTASTDQILGQSSVLAPTFRPFQVERISPEFWQDQMLFTRLEAEVILADGERAVTRINRPLWLGWGDFLRLSGFGYAPRYELATRDGRVVDSAFVKMHVFPPGQRDYFRSGLFPHRFYLEVYPDAVADDRGVASRTLNLVRPAVVASVVRGRVGVADAVLMSGERLELEGLAVSVPEIRYWGEFSVVSDPGAPLLLAAAVVAIAGLVLGLMRRRATTAAGPTGLTEMSIASSPGFQEPSP